jgi:hypothetical protein
MALAFSASSSLEAKSEYMSFLSVKVVFLSCQSSYYKVIYI